MPTMKTKGKTMKEIIVQINEEKDRNPEFSERFKRQLEKLQNYMDECEKFNTVGLDEAVDRDFFERRRSRNQFMERIQIGSQTLREFLGNIKGEKNNSQMLYFAAAFAAAMEPLDRNSQIEMNVFLPDKNGNVKVVPMVENAEKKPAVRKEDLNLWDKLCNLVGYKTEKYRAYEAEQKKNEMLESFHETDSQRLYKHVKESTKSIIRTNRLPLVMAKDFDEKMNRLFFGDKKPEDWVMRDGTKVSALSACMGILSGKEVGVKDIFKVCSPYRLAKEHRGEIKKAVEIYEGLLAKRQTADKFKYLDEFLFDKKFNISSQLEQEFLSKVSPYAEIESFTPDLEVRQGTFRECAGSYKPFENAKQELYQATKEPKYAPVTEDVIIRGELYVVELKDKLASVYMDPDFDRKSTMDLCKNIIKTTVYVDALKSYFEACHEKGETCRNFNSDEKKSMMQAISKKIDELGLSEDSSRAHTIETVEMILQNQVTDSIKAELTVSPDPAITPTVEFKKFEKIFDKNREYELGFVSDTREKDWEKFDIQKELAPDFDNVIEVDEVADEKEQESMDSGMGI